MFVIPSRSGALLEIFSKSSENFTPLIAGGFCQDKAIPNFTLFSGGNLKISFPLKKISPLMDLYFGFPEII